MAVGSGRQGHGDGCQLQHRVGFGHESRLHSAKYEQRALKQSKI
jgi:hypothetical protein